MADAIERATQCHGESIGTGLVALQQVIGHALRGLRAHTRQATQRLDELLERGGFIERRGH
jgi:hypothetical protein